MRRWLAIAALAFVAAPSLAQDIAQPVDANWPVIGGYGDYLEAVGEKPLKVLPRGASSVERMLIIHPFVGATIVRIERWPTEAIATVSLLKALPGDDPSSDRAPPKDNVRHRTLQLDLEDLAGIDSLVRKTDYWSRPFKIELSPDPEGNMPDICIDSTGVVFERLTAQGYRAVDGGLCVDRDSATLLSAYLRAVGLKSVRGRSYRF